ncbi:MAG: tetratricopeptide repeat protein [Pseudomonadota bacterium]|nr:tetratricopeptide repeat protein [Pseudomonadota bacterium]
MINRWIAFIVVVACLLALAPPGVAAPAGTRIWTVQVAFLSERHNAEKMVEELKRREVKGVWVQREGSSYAIRIGRHKNKREALLALGKIRKAYPQAVMKEVAGATAKVVAETKRTKAVRAEMKARQNVGVKTPEKETPAANPGKTPAAGVAAVDESPASIANPLFAEAMKRYERGDFPGAADLFQQVMRQIPADPVAYERSIRRAADCYLSMGGKGANQYLFSAVDHYKRILQHYPDPRTGNDLVYLNLAKGYEGLKFYYESADALKKLLSHYPESVHAQEALFRLAEAHLAVKRHEQGAQVLRQYLDKYRQGVHAKTAALRLAEVYMLLNDLDRALALYEGIAQGMNDLSDMPKEALYSMADAAYRKGRHEETIRFVSVFLSLYPQDEKAGRGLYLLGNSFHNLGRFPTAMKIYNEVLERYAASPEARESILMTANLGVRHPGHRQPAYPSIENHYGDPLGAYNLLLSQQPEKDLEERVLFAKSEALFKNGRYLDAVANFLLLQDKYPDGRESPPVKQQLKAAAKKLIDDLHPRRDYVAIASLYCRTFGRVVFAREDADSLLKIVDALNKMSLHDEALRVSNYVRSLSADPQWQSWIAKTMAPSAQSPGNADGGGPSGETGSAPAGGSRASMELMEKSLADAGADDARRRWLLFEIGRRHMESRESAAAEKSFLQIKDGSPDPFWTKLSDYALQESRWSERYGDFY